MKKQEKQSIKWANEDIEIYYDFIQSMNPTGYTLCPVYAKEGDNDEYSTYDLIQLKKQRGNKYINIPQYIEIKGRKSYSITDYNTALVDLYKIQELQKYGNENKMEVYIVNIWYKDNKITIHKIDLEKDYEKDSELFKNIRTQSAGIVKNGTKKMVHLPLYNIPIYDFNCNV